MQPKSALFKPKSERFKRPVDRQRRSFSPGDIAYIHQLASKPHLNGFAVRIIGPFNSETNRYPIELVSDSQQKGMVRFENLKRKGRAHSNGKSIKKVVKPIQNSQSIQSKPRMNTARFFSSKLMRTQHNFTNSQLIRDIKLFQSNCIYIPRYYDQQRSQHLFNVLQNELNVKLESKELKMDDDDQCQMAFYGKFQRNTTQKLKDPNMFYNKFFSDTFKQIVLDLCAYFDCTYYVTLLNYYKDGNALIPFHQDGLNHGDRNITIGMSFGYERNLTFRHEQSRESFDIPQRSGDVFAFTSKVNKRFKHAILKVKKRKHLVKPRFSIIIFGSRVKLHSRNCGDGEMMFHDSK